MECLISSPTLVINMGCPPLRFTHRINNSKRDLNKGHHTQQNHCTLSESRHGFSTLREKARERDLEIKNIYILKRAS